MSDPASRYAVCESVVRQGSFADDVAMVAAAGIAGMGVDAAAVNEVGAAEAARVLESEGVRASSYLDETALILSDDDEAASIEIMKRRLDNAAEVGAPAVLVITGPLGALSAAEANSRCRDRLASTARLAVDRGVRIMLEPTHPVMRQWSYVHTLRHALSLVDGLEGVGVVVDVGHVWWEEDLHTLLSSHVDQIVTIQLTNVSRDALDELRYERASFDSGDVPVADLIARLESVGYRGWYENEARIRVPRDERFAWLQSSQEWFTNVLAARPT
jgi:sugar phosphate isomerase/epimerase